MYYLKLIMKNNLNFLKPNIFAKFLLPYPHSTVSFRKVSSNANSWMSVLTKKLLDFMTNMLLIVESLFSKTMKLYTGTYILTFNKL